MSLNYNDPRYEERERVWQRLLARAADLGLAESIETIERAERQDGLARDLGRLYGILTVGWPDKRDRLWRYVSAACGGATP